MEEISKAIINYFSSNWSTTSILFPNTNLNTDSLSAWVSIEIVPIDKYRLILGNPLSTASMHEIGMVNINIFVKQNVGSGIAQGYADTIINLFRYKELTTDSGDKLQFGISRIAQNGRNDNNWWVSTVVAYFKIIN